MLRLRDDDGSEMGESAKQRMAEACALKRKVSVNCTEGEVWSFEEILEMAAVNPCKTRS